MSNQFRFQAADAQGRTRSGTVQAASEQAALDDLAAQGLRVFSLDSDLAKASAAPVAPAVLSFGGLARQRVSTQQRGWLLEELATLLEAGVDLVAALESLQQGHAHTAVGQALAGVNLQLRSGVLLSAALKDSGMGWPRYVVELVRSGESTGRLAAAARAAALQLQADEAFAREVRNALLYPALLVVSGLLAMAVVFVFVVPKFASILSNPRADLPLVSQWVLQLGLWMGAHVGVLAVAVVAAGALAVHAARQESVRQRAWEWLGAAPLLRQWVLDAELYRWAAMLALLTQHRVGLLEALAQANATLRTRALAARAALVADAVRQGKSLVDALQAQGLLDASALALVRVGEKTGALDKTLHTLAQRYQTASQQRIKRFLVLLEPVTILVISTVLGGVMISVILAVTSLTNVI